MSYSDSVQLVSTTDIRSPIMKKSKVCRCLFGRPDKETIHDELKRQMDEDLGVAKLRWGYDTQEDTPLPDGPYEWTEVPATEVPSFYTDSKYVERRILKASRKPSRKLRRNLSFSDDDSAAPDLCFAADRLRSLGAESKLNSESSGADLGHVELQDAYVAPIRADISTPCVKQLNKMDLSKTDSSSQLTCAIPKAKDSATSASKSSASETVRRFSGVTSEVVGDKPKKQTHMSDFLKVRKRKASYSLSSISAKNLRRLW